MVAPNPDRCKPLVTVPRAAISSVIPFGCRQDLVNCIRLRLGRDVRLLGCCCRNCAAPRNVGLCQERSCASANSEASHLHRQGIGIARGPALAASFDTICQLMRVIVAPFATPVSRSYELWRG